MSEVTTRANSPASRAGQNPPPSKDLRGLMPYLRRYTGSIIIGLLMVLLMGVVLNVFPLATGVMSDTLAVMPGPYANGCVKGTHPSQAAIPRVSRLIREHLYY